MISAGLGFLFWLHGAFGPLPVPVGRFGDVHVYRPFGPVRETVLLLSDADWKSAEDDAARTLARHGALVMGVDTARYYGLAKPRGCTFAAADLESMSKQVQRGLGVGTYAHPILAGIGAGGRLVYAALAEAPADTFGGAVSAGFCPILRREKMLCRGVDLQWKKPIVGPTVTLLPTRELGNPWFVVPRGETDCSAEVTRTFVAGVGGAHLLPAPAAGPAGLVAALAGGLDRVAAARPAPADRGPLPDLPLVELLAKRQPLDALAVIISGDGGWVSLDRKLGRQLAQRGVGVVGIDSLQYFWSPRSPQGVASDLARILRHYLKAWNKSSALLIGYSQGADVVPFMAAGLPPDLRSRVKLVGIIGSDGSARFDRDLDVAITGRSRQEDLPVLPEIAKLGDMHPVCVFGAQEEETLCHDLKPGQVALVEVPGGHDFSGDGGYLAESFLYEAGLGPKPSPDDAKPPHRRHGRP